MKAVVSISLQEETLRKLEKKLEKNSIFRNKSHLVEVAIEEYLGEEK